MSYQKKHRINSSWWFQPISKICSSNWIISPGWDENKKYLKPPSRTHSRAETFLPSGIKGGFFFRFAMVIYDTNPTQNVLKILNHKSTYLDFLLEDKKSPPNHEKKPSYLPVWSIGILIP